MFVFRFNPSSSIPSVISTASHSSFPSPQLSAPVNSVIPLNIEVPEILGPFPRRAKALPSTSTPESPIPDCLINWPCRELGREATGIFEPHLRKAVEFLSPKRWIGSLCNKGWGYMLFVFLPAESHFAALSARTSRQCWASCREPKVGCSIVVVIGCFYCRVIYSDICICVQSSERLHSARRKLNKGTARSSSNPLVDNSDVDSAVARRPLKHKPVSDVLPDIHPGYIPLLLIKRW